MTELQDDTVDVALIGGGIMSATLGAMLTVLEPRWRIVLVERASEVATESSAAWNNAGTGHAGYCELNYMPDPTDATSAANISRQFQLSRQWWSYLVRQGLLDGSTWHNVSVLIGGPFLQLGIEVFDFSQPESHIGILITRIT